MSAMSDSQIKNCFAGEESLEPGSQRQYSLVDFELIRVIGRGSYAKVLMVELKKTHRIYAMKVIKKALVTDDEVRNVIFLYVVFIPYIYSFTFMFYCSALGLPQSTFSGPSILCHFLLVPLFFPRSITISS